MKKSFLSLILAVAVAAAGLFALTGCNTRVQRALVDNIVITNATPATLVENPSGLYTFTVRVRPLTTAVVKESVRVSLTIDGQTFAMRPSDLGSHLWEYDHAIAVGRKEAAYFITVNYDVIGLESRRFAREEWTEIFGARIVNKYALALEANRGPVGARVAVIGRGFQQTDVVHVGDQPAATTYLSPNSVQFNVPALEADRTYPVKLVSTTGELTIGTFRVDRGQMSVAPMSFTLRRGERRSMTFTLPAPAGPEGVLINVTTDVPQSVIMPEVLVPAGAATVTIPVVAGQPGTGSLFVEVPGFDPITVPLSVL